MGKRKSSTTTEPLQQYKPFVDASLGASQGVFNEWQPKINQRANETLGVYDQLRPGTVAGIQGAQGLVNDTLGGKFLAGGNPYLNDMVSQMRQNAVDQQAGLFSSAGRFGSNAFSYGAGKAANEAELGLRYDNYGRERQAQMQAVEQANGLMNGTMQTLNQGVSLPWVGASNLTNNVRNATSGYAKTTQSQKGSALDTIGQVAAIGATVAPAFSEPGMKENVMPLGTRPDGLGVYKYNYKPETGLPQQPQVGVMADEVQAMRPDALGPTVGGARTVDYGKLQQDMQGLTPKVQQPGIMGAIDRVVSPDASTTLGKVGILGQNLLAAYGNPLGQALVGTRQEQERLAQQQHEMALDNRRADILEQQAAMGNRARIVQRRDGSVVAIDPITLQETQISGPIASPEPLVKVYDPKSPTGERYAPRSEAAGAPAGTPDAPRSGGGGVTANMRATLKAQAADAIARGADPAKVRAQLREMGVN